MPQQLHMVWPQSRLTERPDPLVREGYHLRPLADGDEDEHVRVLHAAGFESWDSSKLATWRHDRALQDGIFVVMHRRSGQIVATAMASHRPTPLHPAGGEVGWVAADPDHAGNGLGRTVTAAALNRLLDAGYTHVFLQTDDHRLPALWTYLQLGLVPYLFAPDMESRWKAVCRTLSFPCQPDTWVRAPEALWVEPPPEQRPDSDRLERYAPRHQWLPQRPHRGFSCDGDVDAFGDESLYRPSHLGQATAAPREVEAGCQAPLTLTYTTGPAGIPEGAGVRFAMRGQLPLGKQPEFTLQGPPGCTLEPRRRGFVVTQGSLEPGHTVTLTFPPFTWTAAAGRREYKVIVQYGDGRPEKRLPEPVVIQVRPRPLARLEALVPASHQPGQPLDVRVTARDEYDNRVSYSGNVRMEIENGARATASSGSRVADDQSADGGAQQIARTGKRETVRADVTATTGTATPTRKPGELQPDEADDAQTARTLTPTGKPETVEAGGTGGTGTVTPTGKTVKLPAGETSGAGAPSPTGTPGKVRAGQTGTAATVTLVDGIGTGKTDGAGTLTATGGIGTAQAGSAPAAVTRIRAALVDGQEGEPEPEGEPELACLSNPSVSSTDRQVFIGDLHCHDFLSEAEGYTDEVYRWAMEDRRLDFVSVVPQSHGWHDNETWTVVKYMNERFLDEGRFVPFLGFEWQHSGYGDKVIHYLGGDQPYLPRDDTRYASPASLYAALRSSDALVIAHHPCYPPGSWCSSTDFDAVETDVERLAELWSMHGSSEGYDPGDRPLRRIDPSRYVLAALKRGVRLGFTGGSDTHSGRPGGSIKEPYPHWGGLTAVWAEQLTRRSVFEALYQRRTYALTRARIVMAFTVNGQPMGAEIPAARDAGIQLDAWAPGAIACVEVLKNGELLQTFQPGSDQCHVQLEDRTGGPAFYHGRVTMADGNLAVCSPVWVG